MVTCNFVRFFQENQLMSDSSSESIAFGKITISNEIGIFGAREAGTTSLIDYIVQHSGH